MPVALHITGIEFARNEIANPGCGHHPLSNHFQAGEPQSVVPILAEAEELQGLIVQQALMSREEVISMQVVYLAHPRTPPKIAFRI